MEIDPKDRALLDAITEESHKPGITPERRSELNEDWHTVAEKYINPDALPSDEDIAEFGRKYGPTGSKAKV